MRQLEIEVKYFITDPDALRTNLQQMGAVSRGGGFEKNIILDTTGGQLRDAGQLLRLRQDACTTLTFKTPPATPDRQYKVLEEITIELNDTAAMQDLLAHLGYHPVRIYEKWREYYTLEDACLCIDRMPFGTFLEIEAPGPRIRDVSRRLNLDWKQRIIMNYLEMFTLLARRLDLPFTDITFADFADGTIDFKPCLNAAQVGSD